MGVVLHQKSCFQDSYQWMSKQQSALASVKVRRSFRSRDRRRWFHSGRACAGTAAACGLGIKYSPSCCPPSRWAGSPVEPTVRMICRLRKPTPTADWEATSDDQVAASSNSETGEKERGGGNESATRTRTVGAVCLIIGTSIGSGILALPERTSPAGFVPSATTMVVCWGFLLVEALLIAEVNVSLLKRSMCKKPLLAEKGTGKQDGDRNFVNSNQELETISFRTMAVETLGDLGGSVATVTYLFLGYTSLVAYCSKSGDLLSQFVSSSYLPPAVLGSCFTTLAAALICFGGYRVADGANQWLTAVMIGLLVAIEVMAGALDKGSLGSNTLLSASDDWSKVPPTIPLIIFSLVYHDITPVICSYLNGDLNRIRFCLMIGSLVPMLCLVIWDAVMLGFPCALGSLPSSDLSISSCFTAAQVLVEPFSLLAVGTSIIGTLLGFSSFFHEQIRSSSRRRKNHEEGLRELEHLTTDQNGDRLIGLLAMAAAVVPTLITSASVADAFDAATDFAGGYCMTILYGILPPAMAWSLKFKKQESGSDPSTEREDNDADDGGRGKLLQARPTLIGAGLLASGVAVLQVVNDCTNLIPSLGLSN